MIDKPDKKPGAGAAGQPNLKFAQDMRRFLHQCQMPDDAIDRIIALDLKEEAIARSCSSAVNTIKVNAASLARKMAAYLAHKQIKTSAQGMVDLRSLGLSSHLILAVNEEMNTFLKYAGSPSFDGAKALTNILRMIKACERPQQKNFQPAPPAGLGLRSHLPKDTKSR